MKRRDFLQVAAGATVMAGMPLRSRAQTNFATKLQKALLAKDGSDATFERIAQAGFPGAELTKTDLSNEEGAAVAKIAAKHGVKVHSLMGGWFDFINSDDTARLASIENARRMIRLTAALGADNILVVPCRVGKNVPKPTQFKIDFDPTTIMVKSVVAGDNTAFAEYIELQNRATDLTRKAVEALVPTAVECGVTIALENVWNNLWVLPKFAAAFVRSFRHERVQAYFDLGNNVRYAPTEEWLREMKAIISRLHIKDFKIDREKKNDGDFVPIGKGDVDWVSVRKVIDEVGYSGWVTIESGGYSDAEHSALMDRFFAGKGA